MKFLLELGFEVLDSGYCCYCSCCKLLIFFPACNVHNFFVRTPFWVLLDSIESPLSLESNHMLFNGIRYPHLKI